MLRNFYRFLLAFGINPKVIARSWKGLSYYRRDLRKMRQLLRDRPEWPMKTLHPILRERFETNGDLKRHYFHEDLFVAQRIFENKPVKHVDVGSRVDGFVAHVASFRDIEVFDIRPQEAKVKNMKFVTADFMDVPTSLHNYADSLSSLNVIEHFGLGRYNDPLDVDGHLKGLENMRKVLKPGGKFYLSTPIGPQRIEFNAHRVFSVRHLVDALSPHYQFDRVAYVDDSGDLQTEAALTEETISNNFGCRYGFIILEMTRKS